MGLRLTHKVQPSDSLLQGCSPYHHASRQQPDAQPTATTAYYTLQNSRPLPTIDCTKTVKSTLLSAQALAICNRAISLTKRWLPILYVTGLVALLVVPFVKARLGRYIAVSGLVMQIPPILTSVLILRYDMVCIVLSTFEFWYITATNVATNILLMMMYDDSRACVAVVAMLGLVVSFLIDASYRDAKMAITGSVGGAFAFISSACLFNLDIVDSIRLFALLKTQKFKLDVDALITNLAGPVTTILLRNAFRKHQSILQLSREAGSSKRRAVIQCITYQCRVELQPMWTDHPHLDVRQPPANNSQVVRLRYVPSVDHIEATNVLLPRRIIQPSLAPWPMYHQSLLHVLGCLALISTCTALIGSSHQLYFVASMVSLATTTVFVTVYASFYQRQLLTRLFHSFDYIFISTHFTLLHLGACDLMYWGHRALAILASWMWTHWLITLDAVTPVMKHKLGYSKHMGILVALVCLLEQILLGLELVFLDYRHLQDRVLFTIHLHNHVKPIRVVPLVLGRLITTVLWTGRILWRILDRRGSELVMLLGRVEYDDVELVRRRKRNKESN